MIDDFLPWQRKAAAQQLAHSDQMAHALLIHGVAGIGKRQYARALAAALLCENRQSESACRQCTACQWVGAGNHPDLMLVRPQALVAREGASLAETDDTAEPAAEDGTTASKKKLSEELRVDDIRALEPWYHRTTHRGGLRIVVLYPAEAMNLVSANALLKSLEEPPENTLFLLVTDASDRLLPTILSRCQKVPMALPALSQSLEWLKAQGVSAPELWLAGAGGAPLRAWADSQQRPSPCPPWASGLLVGLAAGHPPDLAKLAEELATEPATEWMRVLQQMAVDVCLAAAGLRVRYFPGLRTDIQRWAARAPATHWTSLTSWLGEQSQLVQHPLTPKLFAQACLQRFCEEVK